MSGAGAVRLRPLVETVVGDEHLWLLRGPAGGDCRIADPAPAVLPLVELLDGAGGTPRELTTALRRDGLPTEEAEVAGMLAALDAAALLEPVRPEPEDDRFSRQLLYLRERSPAGADADRMQRALREARVAIIGCGGLGSWAAAGLACVGIGAMTLVDGDVVERSNLNRQLLFRERDVGRAKVAAAAETLRAFDSALTLDPVERRLLDVAAIRDCVRGHDVVVACADQPAYDIARWINAACLAEGIPHISAGQ
ncbi:MAG TPA: ThiF family adenylyltransferase, partial [Solirubrobacteraceae bacterium]|nr:ThiF family adenylyltransferase [Solirubrobacteraceae bacterium]